jgi:hypothetical protein
MPGGVQHGSFRNPEASQIVREWIMNKDKFEKTEADHQ